ncbi:hypothetical protein DFJ74DRAFT_713839 [Hyaloraphidium curvatum]|nr:hypothetical protein DFJ74DRAFT_713839 [Hyaloraphidium curvatum]
MLGRNPAGAPPSTQRLAALTFADRANMTLLQPVRNGVDIRRTQFADTVPPPVDGRRDPGPPPCGHAPAGTPANPTFCEACNWLFFHGVPALADPDTLSDEDDWDDVDDGEFLSEEGAGRSGAGADARQRHPLLEAAKTDSGADLSADVRKEEQPPGGGG